MTGVSVQDLTPLLLATSLTAAKTGMRLILILGLGYLAVRVITVAIRHLEAILIKAGASNEPHPGVAHKRVSTLTGVIRTIARSLIWGSSSSSCLIKWDWISGRSSPGPGSSAWLWGSAHKI